VARRRRRDDERGSVVCERLRRVDQQPVVWLVARLELVTADERKRSRGHRAIVIAVVSERSLDRYDPCGGTGTGQVAAVAESRRFLESPSWADRVTAWVDRLPPPSVVVYAMVSMVLFAIVTLLHWAFGAYPVGTFSLAVVTVVTVLGWWLWLIGRFNRAAGSAFDSLGERRLVNPDRAMELRRRLTTLPAVPTLVVGGALAIAAATRVVTNQGFAAQLIVTDEPRSIAVTAALTVMLAMVGAAYVLKIVFVSVFVHGFLRDEVAVNVYQVSSLYRFSRLSAGMAVSVVLTAGVFVLGVPEVFSGVFAVAGAVLPTTLATLAFLVPLAGVHGRLVAEKTEALDACAEKIRLAAARLHTVVDEMDLPRMDPLQKAIQALDTERTQIQRVPTWPWQVDTVRWVVGVLLFPLVLIAIQFVTTRLVP
jgi:hypothetical protein